MANIAFFLNHPTCSVDGFNAISNVLQPYHKIKIFTKHKIPYDNFFNDVDLVLFPGGTGDATKFDTVMKNHKTKIRRYVANGGRYLGICMGAYWAGSYYFDLLNDRDCVRYVDRPGSKTHRSHPKDIDIKWNGKKKSIYWYDGCTIVGKGKMDIVATYPNGDVMAGYQGRVGLIGSHLEADKDWYSSHTWMKKKWKEDKKENWDLLLDFTSDLLKR